MRVEGRVLGTFIPILVAGCCAYLRLHTNSRSFHTPRKFSRSEGCIALLRSCSNVSLLFRSDPVPGNLALRLDSPARFCEPSGAARAAGSVGLLRSVGDSPSKLRVHRFFRIWFLRSAANNGSASNGVTKEPNLVP